MLILTRRPGESILIGDDVEIVLLANKGNQSRIGIKAPPHISILRSEIKNKYNPNGGKTNEPNFNQI